MDSHPTEDVLASPVAIAEPCCQSSPPKLEGGIATSANSSVQWRAGSIGRVERDAKATTIERNTSYDTSQTTFRVPCYQRRFQKISCPVRMLRNDEENKWQKRGLNTLKL